MSAGDGKVTSDAMAVRQDLWRFVSRTVRMRIVINRGATYCAGEPNTLAAEKNIRWNDQVGVVLASKADDSHVDVTCLSCLSARRKPHNARERFLLRNHQLRRICNR